MKCIALDDEPLALQLLETYVAQLPQLTAEGFFSHPGRARQRLEVGDIDLLLLDIEMPDINGLNFLQTLSKPPMVIFTTAYANYAIEGFNLDAIDYLLKPFDFQRFEKAIHKALEYYQFKHKHPNENAIGSLFVKAEYKIVQVAFDDILFIEGFGDYIRIHTTNKSIMTLMRLKNVLPMLPADRFIQVHRSYVVDLKRIEHIRAQKITIGKHELPVGDKFAAILKSMLG
jgi:two-component system, LytTR family, response regulator